MPFSTHRRRVVWGYLAIVLILGFGAMSAISFIQRGNGLARLAQRNHRLAVKAAEDHRALCAFVADLGRRVKQTRNFLRQHPQGTIGIPAVSLRVSLHNQELTLHSLSRIHCRATNE